MKHLLRCMIVLSLWAFPSGGNAAEVEPIDGGYSGSWYNPDQSGHGLLLEILDDDRAFAAWFVFDASGNPFWIVGSGTVQGNAITFEAQALSGAQFPPAFDPARVERREWGTFVIEFDSCAESVLSWDSLESEFGSGQLSLRRLTAIAGLGCGPTERWLADADVMVAQLLATHPDPFASISRAAFERRMADIRGRIPFLPDRLVPVALAELLAAIGDSHTQIFLPAAGLSRLPIELVRVREGLLISKVAAGNEQLLGTVLVSIGGVPAAAAEARVATLIAHENSSWLEAVAPEYLVIPEVLAYLGIVSSPDAVSVQVDRQGQALTWELLTLPDGASAQWVSVFADPRYRTPLYLSRSDNYWSSYLRDSRTLYVAYQRAQQMPGQSLDAFFAGIESFVMSNPVERLVIDLRLNRGGNSGLLQKFIEGTANSPFNDPETLFVLIGRDTFSSGFLNAFDFARLTEATLVGQPTGGKPDHFGEVVSQRLPRSGLRVSYSTRRFEVLGDDTVESLYPDVQADDPGREQFLNGEDPFLEAVIGSR